MRRKCLVLAALLTAVCCLSGCALLPQEETPQTAPLLRTYSRTFYETGAVIRETLTKTATLSCKYVPVQTVGLAFEVGGEYIDEIFVQTGNMVEKGDLLAQLRLDNTEEEIDNVKSQMEESSLRLRYLDELEKIAMERCEIQNAGKSGEELEEARRKVREEYRDRKKTYEDALSLQRITLESLEKKLSQRQIFAPFSGAVTYVRKYDEGARSVKGERIITLSDSTLSLFRTETEYWHLFEPGDEVEITVSKAVYAAVVTTEEELNLPAETKVQGKKANVYFKLVNPALELEEGDSGRLVLTLNEWKDVLTVPSSAVSTAGDDPIIYYVKEDGTRGYKIIQTGETVNRRTIVLSGLEEGEEIILK